MYSSYKAMQPFGLDQKNSDVPSLFLFHEQLPLKHIFFISSPPL